MLNKFCRSGSLLIEHAHRAMASTTRKLPIPDKSVEELDPELTQLIFKEQERQKNGIELIASENFAYKHTMQVSGSCLMNKYSEGYPNARYYGGN